MGEGRELPGGAALIRPPRADDVDGYRALLLDPPVAAWLRPPPLPAMTGEEIEGMLADDLRHWREGGFGPWALVDPDDAELVGRVGLRRTSIGGELVIELAWTVLADWQGRGLATAAAAEAIELGRSLELEEVVALVLPANVSSRRVAAKLRMREAGEVSHAELPHVLYRLAL